MATFRPKSVFISCSLIAFGACWESRAVRPLIPIFSGGVKGFARDVGGVSDVTRQLSPLSRYVTSVLTNTEVSLDHASDGSDYPLWKHRVLCKCSLAMFRLVTILICC